MRLLILVLSLILSSTVQAKVKTYTFGGFDLGVSKVSEKDGEPKAWGTIYGINLGHEIRFENRFNLNLAVGAKSFETKKSLNGQDFDVDSNTINLRINPTYAVYDFLDVGLQLDLMTPGLNVSRSSKEHQIYSVNMYYNIPYKEKDKFRIGVSLGSAFDDSRHTQGLLSFEYSFGHVEKKKMLREDRGIKVIYKTPNYSRSRVNRHIHFQYKSARIDEADKEFLKRLAERVNEEYWGIRKVEIRGYSAKGAGKEYAYTLSKLRAKEVAKELVRHGMRKDMIRIVPIGDKQSIFQGIKYNAEIDRRVIITIVGEDAHLLKDVE